MSLKSKIFLTNYPSLDFPEGRLIDQDNFKLRFTLRKINSTTVGIFDVHGVQQAIYKETHLKKKILRYSNGIPMGLSLEVYDSELSLAEIS